MSAPGVNSVEGKVIFVTGGSSGLGLGAVKHLAGQGATCVVFATDEPTEDMGEKCHYIKGNVCSEEDVNSALNQIISKFGRLDVCVSNAGIFQRHLQSIYDFKTDTPFPLDVFREVLEVNVVGMFNVVRLCAGVIGKNEPNANGERGVIILTGSISGRPQVVQPYMAAYVATKSAVNGITATLAGDLYSQGIRVVNIAPGSFESNLLKENDEEQVEQYLSKYRSNIFPARLGRCEEFGACVQMVVENPLINGSIVPLDGLSKYNLPVPSSK